MPQKIDRIGRATEWATSYYLSRNERNREGMERYLNLLPPEEQKRVLVGAEKLAQKILSMSGGKAIIDAEVIGEESKRPGSEDYDVKVVFDDKSEEGYSLKIQSNSIGVNVRNPTLNSLCKSFTGKKFEEFLTADEIERYQRWGMDYSQGRLESNVVGRWGAQKLAGILRAELRSNPRKFIETMLKEIRYKTNLLIAVVDKNAKFQGYVTKFVDLFSKLESAPKRIEIVPSGISVAVLFDKIPLFHIDLYMMSSSSGKGKKLRGAIRVNFEINEKA